MSTLIDDPACFWVDNFFLGKGDGSDGYFILRFADDFWGEGGGIELVNFMFCPF